MQVNDDDALLAAASLCMDLLRSHVCLPLRLTDDESSCHCLDLALSHVCELTARGLSVGYHLSALKQHAPGIAKVSLCTYCVHIVICRDGISLLVHLACTTNTTFCRH